jgi:hypothetical protein
VSDIWADSENRAWPVPFRAAAWLIGLLGVARATWHYAQANTFFIDEVKLLWNVADRDWWTLFEPLQNNQVAPVGFLVMEKAVISTLGVNELGSRFLPLLSMALAVALFIQISRRLLSPVSGLIAIVLFAWSGPLIYYASQTKQYTLDVLAAAAILLATLAVLKEPEDRRRWILLLATGVVATVLSIPAVIVLAGTTITLIVASIRRGTRSDLGLAAALAAVWMACFGLLYLWKYRFEGNSDYMAGYWTIGFLPPFWHPIDFSRSLLSFADRLMREVVGVRFQAAGLVAYLLGLIVLLRRKTSLGLLMVSAMAVAVLLSSLHLYPLKERAALYLLPFLVLPMAVVWDEAARSRDPFPRIAAGVLLGVGLVGTLVGFVSVETRADIKPVMRQLLDEAQVGDVVYVYWRPQRVIDSYDRWDLGPDLLGDPRLTVVRGEASIDRPLEYIDMVESLVQSPGVSRVWFLYSRRYKEKGLDEVEIIRRAFAERGELISSIQATDAGAWLYELSPTR